MREKHVKLEGRTFIVIFDDEGVPQTIKVRKVYEEGKPWERIYNSSYWHKSHAKKQTRAKVGNKPTLVQRIIAEAMK